MSAGDAAVLVVRVWWETGSAGEFRARVTSRLDVASEVECTQVTVDPAEIVVAVHDWLRDCLDRHG